MELTLGSVYQKQNFNYLLKHFAEAERQGFLDTVTHQMIRRALARLASDSLTPDYRMCTDLDIIHQGLDNYKPAYLSRWSVETLLAGALKGAFVLCLAVAISPTLPVWLCVALPSVVALTDYLLLPHAYAQDIARNRLAEFNNSYLRDQIGLKLINQDNFMKEALDKLMTSPFKDTLSAPLLALRSHLLMLYKSGGLTVEGAIGLHQKMNELMAGLEREDVNRVYRELGELEQLVEKSTTNNYQATKTMFAFGAIVSVCILALTALSAGTFAGFCATVYAVSLMTAQCAVFGYVLDSIGNLCGRSNTRAKWSPFSSSVKTLFQPMREKDVPHPPRYTAAKEKEEVHQEDDIANSAYLKLATG